MTLTPALNSPQNPWFRWIILINIIFVGVIGAQSAIAGFVSDSTLQASLMLSNDDMRWVSISFIMMLGILIPLAVFLAERLGYKRLFLYGLIVFLLGSFLDSVAYDLMTVMISRAIAGAGAGALFPLSIAIIDQVFPKRQMTIALALYVGIVFGLGSGVGYVLGGYCSQYLSWRFPSLLCSIAGLPSIVITQIFHLETESKKDKKFDTPGYMTFVVFIASIFLILVSGKAEWNAEGWISPFLIFCYALAALSFFHLHSD